MKTFTRIRPIADLLRLAALSVFLSGVTFLLPASSIDSFLVWCGLEPVPHVRLMRYVLFVAGLLQVGIGVVVWVIARDVVRYQPVVVTVLVAFLIGAPAFYLFDALAGMPRWWCILEFACCFLAGGVPLGFCLWPTSPNKAPQATAAAPGS